MNTLSKKILSSAVALSVLAGASAAAAAPYGYGYGHGDHGQRWEHRYEQRHQHKRWRKGARIDRAEWNRAHRIDYRAYRLRQPPRGYEWRRTSTGEVILAAIATGLILDLMLR